MKKTLIAVFALLILCLTLTALADTYGDYEYEVNADGTATITNYTGSENVLDVASVLDGHTVTAIGDYAFYYCRSLKSISIPDSVSSVGANPFKYCTKLTTINVSLDSKYLAVIDGVLFEKTEKRLVAYPCTSTAKSYTVPNGIKVIGDCAFSSCKPLTGISIPDSVTSIGDSAFFFCESLTGISIPDSVTSIGDYAFDYCTSLTATVGRDSYAKQYCIDNGIKYAYADSLDWLNS